MGADTSEIIKDDSNRSALQVILNFGGSGHAMHFPRSGISALAGCPQDIAVAETILAAVEFRR